jgi:hypothetical protein
MNILKIALLCSLRVAFFASLKVALLAYTLFLSDTAFASAVPEGNGNAGDTNSSAGPEGNGHVDIASYSSREGTDTSVTPPPLQRPKAMATSTFRDVARCPRPRPTMTCCWLRFRRCQ